MEDGNYLTGLDALLRLGEERDAPRLVQASPLTTTRMPCIRQGKMWWLTSGAEYSEL